MKKPTLTIDLEAIKQNYLFLRQKAFPAECSAVVKANCYGLGVKEIAPVLEEAGCRLFFVATLDEGIELRQILPAAQIAVLNGPDSSPIPSGEGGRSRVYKKDNTPTPTLPPQGGGRRHPFLEYNLIPVLNSLYEINRWQYSNPVMLHMDTGMNRLGLTEEEIKTAGINKLNIKYIISHLACADEPENPMNREQLEKFKSYKTLFPNIPFSLAASSAIFFEDNYKFEMVRPGIALYGGNPTSNHKHPMKNVVKLTAPVIAIREVKKGETIGYGRAYRADSDKKIATIPIGYGDGYLRSLEGKAEIMIKGKSAKVVGRISMDLITVDVTHINDVKINDEAELINDIITFDKLADWAGTIPYEILTNLGDRYERRYTKTYKIK